MGPNAHKSRSISDVSSFSTIAVLSFGPIRLRALCVEVPQPGWGILKGGPQLADRAETADHIHKDATDRYAPCLRALLLFARPIVNIGDFYYCVVLTILNIIPNGITCI